MRYRSLALAIILNALTSPVGAQGRPSAALADTTGTGPAAAPLVIGNRQIVVFRAQLFGNSPRERARAAETRVLDLAEAPGSDSVVAQQIAQGQLVTMGGKLAFVITADDVDRLAGETLEEITTLAVGTLHRTVMELREERSWGAIFRSVGLTILATGVFMVAVAGLRRLYRWLTPVVLRAGRRRAKRLVAQGLTSRSFNEFLVFVKRLLAVVAWAFGLLAANLWLTFSLEQFPYTRPWGEHLSGYLASAIAAAAIAILRAVPGLLVVIFILFVTRLVIRLVNTLFGAIERGRVRWTWFDAETAQPTRRIIVAVLWLFAIALAYPNLPGSDSKAVQGISVLVGLMVSLGSTSVVGQLASGLILMYARAIRPGEYVRIDQTQGVVLRLGTFSTRIRTDLGEEVNIPNAVILATTIKNFTRLAGGRGIVVTTSVTIGYSAPWRQIHAMLLQAAEQTPGLRRQPPPIVFQPSLCDFYVEYTLRANLERPEERLRVLTSLHANIQDIFNEHGVQIMSPHYMMDPEAPVVIPRAQWFPPPASPPDQAPR